MKNSLYNKLKKLLNIILKRKLLLIVILIYISLTLSTLFLSLSQNKTPPWSFILCPIPVYFLCFLLYYDIDIISWLIKKIPFVKKFISPLISLTFYATPIITFFISMQFAKLYFKDTLSLFEVITISAVIAGQLFFIFYYCIELAKTSYNLKRTIEFFLFSIVHIMQLFANIFILILVLNNTAFSGINATSPFELCFDLTYFSIMTFLGGNNILLPISRIVQFFVIVESFIFTLYISIVLLGILSNRQTKK